jgi:hypothetical protein
VLAWGHFVPEKARHRTFDPAKGRPLRPARSTSAIISAPVSRATNRLAEPELTARIARGRSLRHSIRALFNPQSEAANRRPISGGCLSFLRTITDSDLDVRQMGWRATSLALGLLGTVRSPGSFWIARVDPPGNPPKSAKGDRSSLPRARGPLHRAIGEEIYRDDHFWLEPFSIRKPAEIVGMRVSIQGLAFISLRSRPTQFRGQSLSAPIFGHAALSSPTVGFAM